VRLQDRHPGWAQTEERREPGKGEVKERARALLAKNIEGLAAAQELLWPNDTCGVLVVPQAMDAAGKDGTIKHVNGEEERPPAGTLDELLW
jgi:polyphosphate kinase 2 (PPK2 family)